jgi:acyl-CoA reductase-like NAD-dependent aldehyde dehydrogenase
MSELVVRAPYRGKELGRLARPGVDEVERAVAAAARAFETTRKLPTWRREEILRRAAESIRAKESELAKTISEEAGKPMKAARTEAQRAVATFLAAASETGRRSGEVMPLDVNAVSEGRWGIIRRFPLGPVLAITPFNFPLNLVAHKVAPAIAVGAPIVQKPASQTPLSSVALRKIVLDAGWPEDAYALLPISGDDAERLVTDPRLPVVSFTGSSSVGWRLRALAPKKRVSLELGGNAAAIVHSDANLEDAAQRVVTGAFSYAGQSCISLQRALVHRSVFSRVSELVVERTRKVVVGDPLDDETDVGPMITEKDAARVVEWIGEAVAQGARVLAGGTREGAMVAPTVLADTTASMKVECEELFAPVMTLGAYDTPEEALHRVNDSRFGLQAGIFSNDLSFVMRAFETLEVGALVVNDVPTWRADRMPYGGVKDSGNAREGPGYAMDEMTEPRLLALRV